jgi:chromosome segregation ATPase
MSELQEQLTEATQRAEAAELEVQMLKVAFGSPQDDKKRPRRGVPSPRAQEEGSLESESDVALSMARAQVAAMHKLQDRNKKRIVELEIQTRELREQIAADKEETDKQREHADRAIAAAKTQGAAYLQRCEEAETALDALQRERGKGGAVAATAVAATAAATGAKETATVRALNEEIARLKKDAVSAVDLKSARESKLGAEVSELRSTLRDRDDDISSLRQQLADAAAAAPEPSAPATTSRKGAKGAAVAATAAVSAALDKKSSAELERLRIVHDRTLHEKAALQETHDQLVVAAQGLIQVVGDVAGDIIDAVGEDPDIPEPRETDNVAELCEDASGVLQALVRRALDALAAKPKEAVPRGVAAAAGPTVATKKAIAEATDALQKELKKKETALTQLQADLAAAHRDVESARRDADAASKSAATDSATASGKASRAAATAVVAGDEVKGLQKQLEEARFELNYQMDQVTQSHKDLDERDRMIDRLQERIAKLTGEPHEARQFSPRVAETPREIPDDVATLQLQLAAAMRNEQVLQEEMRQRDDEALQHFELQKQMAMRIKAVERERDAARHNAGSAPAAATAAAASGGAAAQELRKAKVRLVEYESFLDRLGVSYPFAAGTPSQRVMLRLRAITDPTEPPSVEAPPRAVPVASSRASNPATTASKRPTAATRYGSRR